ncbi:hypothetical protein CUU64_11645 [Bacillus sp. V5-8f]|nr:hypothetical protein CUU64_11645 [Bacillus sp. V5-8f]
MRDKVGRFKIKAGILHQPRLAAIIADEEQIIILLKKNSFPRLLDGFYTNMISVFVLDIKYFITKCTKFIKL